MKKFYAFLTLALICNNSYSNEDEKAKQQKKAVSLDNGRYQAFMRGQRKNTYARLLSPAPRNTFQQRRTLRDLLNSN